MRLSPISSVADFSRPPMTSIVITSTSTLTMHCSRLAPKPSSSSRISRTQLTGQISLEELHHIVGAWLPARERIRFAEQCGWLVEVDVGSLLVEDGQRLL